MNVKDIINTALANLQENIGVVGIFRDNHEKQVDGELELVFKNKRHFFLAVVKKEVRPHQLAQLTYLQQKFKRPVILVAENIVKTAKDELRELEIPYLEVNGNVRIQLDDNLIWVELKRAEKVKAEKNRAFTPAGLQAVFEMLLNPAIIELTQREMANTAKVGLGQINYVLNGLKKEGFLIRKDKTQWLLKDKELLLERWIGAYNQRLKPKLKIGNFRFVKPGDFDNWDKVKLKKGHSFWGGEPAGNLLTGNLFPKYLTVYTNETQKDLIDQYMMIPDVNGTIEVYKAFWQNIQEDQITVPEILVYADLINSNDKRCRDTALMIYEQRIKNRFI